jgi:hypothetical protein
MGLLMFGLIGYMLGVEPHVWSSPPTGFWFF